MDKIGLDSSTDSGSPLRAAGCAPLREEAKSLGPQNQPDESRIILIDKPAGMSSFGVVARVRRQLSAELGRKVKVGHTGTLDPFATGLLILLSGKMTKKSGEFLKLDKEYEATLRLGYVSTTGDPEGEIVKVCNHLNEGLPEVTTEDEGANPITTGVSDPSPNLSDYKPSKAQVEAVLQKFIGKISQTVPKFSAVKINGQRAYKLARAGRDFETPTREVTIYEVKILRYEYPELELRCHVSSGTYIRTLAEDIGKALGTGAYLTALRRTRVGKYSVADAITLPSDAPKP